MPSLSFNSFAIGIAMKFTTKAISTPTNIQKRMVLEIESSHKTDSIKSVNRKYNKPIAKNKIAPFMSSLV